MWERERRNSAKTAWHRLSSKSDSGVRLGQKAGSSVGTERKTLRERRPEFSQHSCRRTRGDAGLETMSNRKPIPSHRAGKPHAPWYSVAASKKKGLIVLHTRTPTHINTALPLAHTSTHTRGQMDRGGGEMERPGGMWWVYRRSKWWATRFGVTDMIYPAVKTERWRIKVLRDGSSVIFYLFLGLKLTIIFSKSIILMINWIIKFGIFCRFYILYIIVTLKMQTTSFLLKYENKYFIN